MSFTVSTVPRTQVCTTPRTTWDNPGQAQVGNSEALGNPKQIPNPNVSTFVGGLLSSSFRNCIGLSGLGDQIDDLSGDFAR